jgi:hypothetical protein
MRWKEEFPPPPSISALQVKFTTAPALPVILYPEDIVVGGNEGATSTAFSVTSFPGPDLNELQETFAPLPLSFEKAEVPAGKVVFFLILCS